MTDPPRYCRHCGALLQRKCYANGKLESLCHWAVRHYCNKSCDIAARRVCPPGVPLCRECGKNPARPRYGNRKGKYSLTCRSCQKKSAQRRPRRNGAGDQPSLPWHSNFVALLRQYQLNARLRGLPFALTPEQALDLFRQRCHYCGTAPSGQCLRAGGKIPFIYNGIDRMNSDQGYVVGNVVPCCTRCNRCKTNIPYEEFKAWVLRCAAWLMAQKTEPGVVSAYGRAHHG